MLEYRSRQGRVGVLRLNELKLPLEHGEADLATSICRRLKLAPEALLSQRVVKRSVDARKKAHIQLTYSVEIELEPALEQKLLQRFRKDPHLQPAPNTSYQFVARAPAGIAHGTIPRPVVIGAGPCGYFCALVLAQMGYRPLLLERGKPVKERSADTFGFWRGKTPFNPESNAQFGEGGAGTFSDGKLYSQVRDPNHYGRKVLEEFVAAGANPEILVLHRPHIGTFKLATVVRGLRAQIERLGGEIRFESRVDQISIEKVNGQRRVRGVQLSDGSLIPADHVVVAVGHSARDTFTMLHANGVAMEAKPFSVGFRIEHPQPLIDQARWGNFAGHPLLGAAEYKLVHHASNGRCVYSFCMCPGGLVVGATSEEGRVVTNGMSQHSRNERNANSGIVVNIEPEDVAPYGSGAGDPLAGVAFQRHWDSQAFELGGRSYAAPGQRLGDFLKKTRAMTRLVKPGHVVACAKHGSALACGVGGQHHHAHIVLLVHRIKMRQQGLEVGVFQAVALGRAVQGEGGHATVDVQNGLGSGRKGWWHGEVQNKKGAQRHPDCRKLALFRVGSWGQLTWGWLRPWL